MSSITDFQTLRCAGLGAFFRARDAAALGIHPRRLGNLVAEGFIQKFQRGLYRFPDSVVNALELETIAKVSAAVPNAIVCLASALYIHEIGTQAPYRPWFAIDRKARVPRNLPTQLHIVRFSGVMLTYGVERRMAQGVPFRITSPARTVVDCFRYRRTCGFGVAMEALYDAILWEVVTADEIKRVAEICRARTVIAPYLDAFSWLHSLGKKRPDIRSGEIAERER